MPFCSTRCRQIDLGRWFNEEFGFPVESNPMDELTEEDDGHQSDTSWDSRRN